MINSHKRAYKKSYGRAGKVFCLLTLQDRQAFTKLPHARGDPAIWATSDGADTWYRNVFVEGEPAYCPEGWLPLALQGVCDKTGSGSTDA